MPKEPGDGWNTTKTECKEKCLENMQPRTQVSRQPLAILLKKSKAGGTLKL
ncbi:MAG TPA: hypothetical protein VNA23_04355 [Anaerolineales bacterium]|nr:hypothetical protein [Anaerolineales bacterium]